MRYARGMSQRDTRRLRQISKRYTERCRLKLPKMSLRNLSKPGQHIRERLTYGRKISNTLLSCLTMAVRFVRFMYATNAVASVHSSFRKVTKQGACPNENALLKLLYLRITELYAKRNGSRVQNRAMVRN